MVSILLVITAILKISGAILGSDVYCELDPIFHFRFRSLMVLAAMLEMIVVVVCNLCTVRSGLISIVWISTSIGIYRYGIWWLGWKSPCGCLGSLTDALHISPQLADDVMKCVLAFMFIGSVSLLMLNYRKEQVVPAGSASTSASNT